MKKALKEIASLYNEYSRAQAHHLCNKDMKSFEECTTCIYVLVELLVNMGCNNGKQYTTQKVKDSLGVEYWKMTIL